MRWDDEAAIERDIQGDIECFLPSTNNPSTFGGSLFCLMLIILDGKGGIEQEVWLIGGLRFQGVKCQVLLIVGSLKEYQREHFTSTYHRGLA